MFRENVVLGKMDDGTTKRVIVQAKTKGELHKKIAMVMINNGIVVPKAKIVSEGRTLGDVLEEYNAYFRKNIRQNVRIHYQYYIDSYLANLCKMPIADISPAVLRTMFDELEARKLSNSTLQKVRSIISPAFQYAREDLGIIDRNPMLSKHVSKLGGVPARRHAAISPVVMRDVLTRLDELPYDIRAMVIIMYTCAARTGEMLGLRWEDIDLNRENSEIHICRQVVHPKRNQAVIAEPKTATGVRFLPLSPLLLDVIGPIQKSGYIVSGEKPLSYTEYRKRQKKFLEHFGLEKSYTMYSLRSTRLTEMAEDGTPIDCLAQFAGHAEVSTTRKYYLHVRERGMDILAKAVGKDSRFIR